MSNDATPDSPPFSTVGAKIRELRKRAHMTQRQLAGTAFSDAYISRIEHGRKPSPQALEWIAQQLGVSGEDLLAIGVQQVDTLWQRRQFAETGYTQAYAETLLATGDIPTAATTLRALRSRLGAQSSKTLIGLCAYVASLEGDVAAARQALDAYTDADAPEGSLAESAALHWLKGLIASVEKTYSLAVAEYEQAITASAESYLDAEIAIEAHISLAETLLRVRDTERAYATQAKAIELYEATTNPMRRGERIRALAAKAVAKRDFMRAYRLMKVAETVYRDVRTMKNVYALYLRHALMDRPAISLTQRAHDLRQALALARRLEDTSLGELACALLTLIHLEAGQEDEAEALRAARDGLPEDADTPPDRPALEQAIIVLARAYLAHAETPETPDTALALLRQAEPMLLEAALDTTTDIVLARYAYEKAWRLYEALGQEEAGLPILRAFGRLRAE